MILIKAQSQGGEAAPAFERLKNVMQELGIEEELFNQVVDGMKAELESTTSLDDSAVLQSVLADLGSKIKSLLKSIAAEQLRIKS